MNGRLERLLTLIQHTTGDDTLSVPARLCLACPAAMGVDGAGVSLITARQCSPVAASDQLASEVEGFQASMGEGPCYDAVVARSAVMTPDLSAGDALDRWPDFARSALGAGVRAVFGFPLTVGGNAIGALDMYSRTRRSLSDDDVSDALLLADLAAIAVRDLSARGRIAEVGLSSGLDAPWAHHSVVHHATGMSAVHLGVDVDEALLRLRAFAFATGRPLPDVAVDVVGRRLKLEIWTEDR